MLYQAWNKNLNSPLSSSVGRLFDAVASLSGICQIQSYEGETGLLTEREVKDREIGVKNSFNYSIKDGIISIDWDFFDKDLILKFYATLIKITLDLAQKERLPVILSGGVFQNKILLNSLSKTLKENSITFYYKRNFLVQLYL